MASAMEGKSKLGIPPSVGKEFMAADQGGKLPAKAPKPAKSRASRLYKAKGIARG
jgi:hypothetical protein